MASRIHKLVVVGLIVEKESVLLSQRMLSQTFPGKWEFPGGKVETSEDPIDALHRELKEELGVCVDVKGIWEVLFHPYPSFDVVLLVYLCRLRKDQIPQSIEVEKWEWVEKDKLGEYQVLEADKPLVERLCREGIPIP